jgi:hypothetical protein
MRIEELLPERDLGWKAYPLDLFALVFSVNRSSNEGLLKRPI